MLMANQLQTIGRQEIIDLPEFDLENVEAKVDTGAYTSSINCSRLKTKEIDGVEHLTFYLSGSKIHEKKARRFVTKNFKKKRIRSSNGQMEERFIITTTAVFFGKKIKMDFSLADRSKMKFPILLGRKLLSKKFVVDVSKKNLSYQAKEKK